MLEAPSFREGRVHLSFYRKLQYAWDIDKVVAALQDFCVVEKDLGEAENQVVRPFSSLKKKSPAPTVPGTEHKALHISADVLYWRELLLSLKPGIRGWDLPLDAAVLGFDPTRTKRFGTASRAGCPVRKTWDQSKSCNAPAVDDYLQMFGLALGWEPPALRFVASSPFPQDDGAPLLLLRLSQQGTAMGFQKVRLDNGNRENLAFDTCSVDNAIGTIWAKKPTLAVATCLEDVLARQNRTRIPCVLAPTPRALDEMVLYPELEKVVVYLPNEPSEAWLAAADSVGARCQTAGVRFLGEECPFASDGELTPSRADWADFQKGHSAALAA